MRFIQYGFGPIGQRVASYALSRGMQLDAVIDADPEKAGKPVSAFLPQYRGNRRVQDTPEGMKRSTARLVFLTTNSYLRAVMPQLEHCVAGGKHVVSTNEELAFPWKTHPRLARRLDRLARRSRVAVLGTGVNPGFVMDALPAFLSSAVQQVSSIRIERHQDAGIRRLPFQRKIGAGLTAREFMHLARQGRIRHVGFAESCHMLAHALGWKLDRVVEKVLPVIAKKTVRTKHTVIPKGHVLGVNQVCKAYVGQTAAITMDFQAYVANPRQHDEVIIRGKPGLVSRIEGGVNGDTATAAIVVNAAKNVVAAQPGLRTMLDIGLVSWH